MRACNYWGINCYFDPVVPGCFQGCLPTAAPKANIFIKLLGVRHRSKEEIMEEIRQLQNEMTKLDEGSHAETAASKEN